MKLALITGASAGLGAEFAAQLAERGYALLLVARRAERLEALAAGLRTRHGAPVETLALDLSVEADLRALMERIAGLPRLDLLVNNAGFGTKGLFHETDYERQLEMVRVHVLATMGLTRAALPGMIRRGEGGIINVASVAGFWRSVGNVSYCATKGWMNDFTEGVRLELESLGSGVRVQSLCPGFTYTEFHDVMGADRALVPRWLWMPAEYVVRKSLEGLEAGRLFVIPNWKYRLGAALGELLPWRWRVKLELASPHKKKAY